MPEGIPLDELALRISGRNHLTPVEDMRRWPAPFAVTRNSSSFRRDGRSAPLAPPGGYTASRAREWLSSFRRVDRGIQQRVTDWNPIVFPEHALLIVEERLREQQDEDVRCPQACRWRSWPRGC